MTNKNGLFFCVALLLLAGMCAVLNAAAGGQTPGQAAPAAVPAKEVPVMDGEAGACTLEITVNDAAGKPVYATQVRIVIRHGFKGKRKVDLSAYTNEQGRLNFKGLPARVYRGPMEIQAKKEQLTGSSKWDPVDGCNTKQTIVLGAAGR
jgi:hypothetical protein